MSNFFNDNEDLRFYFDHWLDWEPIVTLTEATFRDPDGFKNTSDAVEFYRDVIGLVGEFAATEIAPHAAQIDREGVELVDGEAVFPKRLADIFEAIKGLELHGLCLPRQLGGLNVPMAVYMMNIELFSRADVSVAAHNGFHGGIAAAMLLFSFREGTTTFDPETLQITGTRWADEVAEIVRGDAWGCMDITEPDAGSDMAALRTYAEQDADGNWFVTGQKIFITSGHGKYHFVIARTEGAADPNDPMAGLAGLSMFLVPTYHEDAEGNRTRVVTINRLEEKIGHHGSATASLSFDRAPAQLVGKRGEGFSYMLTLMNNARLAVGFECLGICESALRMAKDYAAERRSMGKSIDRHEMLADYLEEMETDIQGIRALAVQGVYHEEIAQKAGIVAATGLFRDDLRVRRFADELGHHKAAARRYTPLLKYLAAEKAVEISRRAIQIHGGAGYTKDYGAERLLRDALVMPIYEGTSQIQSLMVMKDTLSGIIKNPQGFITRLAQASWRARSSREPLERRVARLQQRALRAQQHLMTRTATDKVRALRDKPLNQWPQQLTKNWNPKRDFAFAMLHAERLTRLLADEAICELLLEQSRRFPERRDILERYLERAEPRSRFLFDEITTTGDRLLGRLSGGSTDDNERAAS
jgi:alkylation response protein AidB-like acyl-CoA dehydrogenase